MSEQTLHVVQGFRPTVRHQVHGDMVPYFETFSIPYDGIPAPVFDDRYKAAVLVGDTPTKAGEVPILDAMMQHSEKINQRSKCWFVGAGKFAVLEQVFTDYKNDEPNAEFE